MSNSHTPQRKKTFTCRFPVELLERVRTIADGVGISPSEMARLALRSGIAEVEKRCAPIAEKPEGAK